MPRRTLYFKMPTKHGQPLSHGDETKPSSLQPGAAFECCRVESHTLVLNANGNRILSAIAHGHNCPLDLGMFGNIKPI